MASDIRNAAGVRSYLQTLANRTRFLLDRLSALADITALKAISAPADQLVRFVKSKGLYVFDAASVATESLPFVVAPNVGSGRWLHELYAVQATVGGLATLDGAGRLAASQLANRIVAASTAKLTSSFSTSSGLVDVTGLSLSFNAQAGDIIDASLSVGLTNTGSGSSTIHLTFVDGGGDVFVGARCNYDTAGSAVSGYRTIATQYTVVNTGTVTVKAKAGVNSATAVAVSGDASGLNTQSNIRALQIRP